VSPYFLVQEWIKGGDGLYGWRMLVACQLLNRTQGVQARPALASVLHRWPTPEALAAADGRPLSAALRPLGLWRRRLQAMSAAWAAGARRPEGLPGCGPYAAASWRIFVEGALPRRVEDGRLNSYVKWRRRHEPIA
jgi:adenine-specific DNA glycosylase